MICCKRSLFYTAHFTPPLDESSQVTFSAKGDVLWFLRKHQHPGFQLSLAWQMTEPAALASRDCCVASGRPAYTIFWVAEALPDTSRSKPVTIQQPHAIRMPGCSARAVPADPKKRSALDSPTAQGLCALLSGGAGRGARCPSTPSKQNSTSPARLPVQAELRFLCFKWCYVSIFPIFEAIYRAAEFEGGREESRGWACKYCNKEGWNEG